MAAPSLSLSLTLTSDPQTHQRSLFLLPPPNRNRPLSFPQKSLRPNFKTFCSHSSPSTPVTTNSASDTYSQLEDSFKTGRFLSNEELEKLKILQDFRYSRELRRGSMWVRVMRAEEVDMTVKLLADSFLESLLLPVGYVSLLRFLMKQYLTERRAAMPHAVTLIAFYKGTKEEGSDDEGEGEMAGTVEVCFDKRGANASPPSPTPPKDSPYICNMSVMESLRRRGIGWNLLKASEELISKMSCKREVYLHCRMIDSAPFNMYTKAGYEIVRTDSILVLVMLQRRKHLMRKNLPFLNNPLGLDTLGSDTEFSSQLDR